VLLLAGVTYFNFILCKEDSKDCGLKKSMIVPI